MNFSNPVMLIILGLIALGVGVWLARHYFSAEARWERRRRRSNRPVSPKTKRPMVKFSVRTKKDRPK